MSVFSNIKPRPSSPRNGFDLGRFSSFSAKLGQIQPVFQQMTLPSGEYSLDISQLLRTQPLQTAAFTGFSINYDVVWCPINHLYSSFNQFVAQRENKNVVLQPSYRSIPVFDLYRFVRYLIPYAFYDYCLSFYSFTEIREYCYHESVRDVEKFSIKSEHGDYSIALSCIRNLDLLGYTNLLPYIKTVYNRFISNHGTSIVSFGTFLTAFNTDFNCIVEETSGSYLDFQTYDDNFDSWVEDDICIDPRLVLKSIIGVKPTLWSALVYNKSFYEYYRNSYYDIDYVLYFLDQYSSYGKIVFDYVQLFNLDDYSSGSVPSFQRLTAIFAIKPHLYKRDLFTGVLPDTQFGDVSVMSENDVWHNLLSTDGSAIKEVDGVNAGAQFPGLLQDALSPGQRQFKLDPATAISILEFRRADSMQRFKERMMRAGDKTKDIFVAHGWDRPKSELSMEPLFLGSFDGRLDINTVASTAATADADLGQLAANGVAVVSGQKIKIKTSDFGVLMVFFHVDKDAVYNSFGINSQHMLTEAFDFPYPELQNISLAPVDRLQLSGYSQLNNNSQDLPSRILGYLPRFMQFKTAVDEVHGEFFSFNPVEGYTNEQDLLFILDSSPKNGVFADWVSVRKDNKDADKLSFLYIHPSDCDSIFSVQANARQESDPFLVNVKFECYAVEPLSVIGLPQ